MYQFKCSCVQRFELLVNQFASIVMKKNDNTDDNDPDKKSHNIVEVYNIGVGGTGSSVGASMVKYWMYPGMLKSVGPDVIIHSYSTNGKFHTLDIHERIKMID